MFLRQFLGLKVELNQIKKASTLSNNPENEGRSSHHLKIRKEMVAKIDKLGEVQVRQIMQARVSIVSVSTSTDYQQLLEIIRESGYSRIPVYENDLDSVTGLLHVKDLIGLEHEKTKTTSGKNLSERPYCMYLRQKNRSGSWRLPNEETTSGYCGR